MLTYKFNPVDNRGQTMENPMSQWKFTKIMWECRLLTVDFSFSVSSLLELGQIELFAGHMWMNDEQFNGVIEYTKKTLEGAVS